MLYLARFATGGKQNKRLINILKLAFNLEPIVSCVSLLPVALKNAKLYMNFHFPLTGKSLSKQQYYKYNKTPARH